MYSPLPGTVDQEEESPQHFGTRSLVRVASHAHINLTKADHNMFYHSKTNKGL